MAKLTDENEVLRLYSEGVSGKKIAELLGVGKTQIFRILKQNNIKTNVSKKGVNGNGERALSAEETMKRVMQLIKQSETEKITKYRVKEEDSLLWFSIKHHYKTLSNAVKLSGEYVLDRGIRKEWDQGYLLEQIKLGYELGMPLNSDHMTKGFGCSTEYFARKTFGSWENAIKAAGINYEEIRQDGSTLAPLGHEFEMVVSELFTDLDMSFSRYDHDKYRPDFVLGNEWVDAKLSQFTYRTPDDNGLTVIDKYEPHCDKLTLVFLRGNKEYDASITEKTRLVNVYKYINRLPENLRGNYYARLDEIERKADAV